MSSRYRPCRAGIFNIWQFDEQVYDFRGGRLVLRGQNGSGKTKSLELLFPLLYDADLTPIRLDPFGSSGRSMRDNLLENGFADDRCGYSWLEFEREGEDGDSVYLTIGIGMRARATQNGVESWFFVTDRRPLHEFQLREGQAPVNRSKLAELLGGENVYQNARDYRQRVDRELFALGPEGYEGMIGVLLQLRSPQLASKLDPRELTAHLSRSLPPLDSDRVGVLAEQFDRLEQIRADILRTETASAQFDVFVGAYRRYSQQIATVRLGEFQSVRGGQAEAKRRRVEAAEALTQAQAALAAHGEAEQAAGKDLVLAEAREQALRESEAYKSAQALAREREIAAVAETAAAFARTQAAEAETALADARTQVEKAANDFAAEQKRLGQTLAQVQAAAERGRFLALHTATVAVKDGDPLAAQPALVALGEAQLARIDEIGTKLAETETLQRLAVEAENAQAERETAREKAEEAHEQAQEQLAEQRAALLEAIDQWAESSEPLDREGAFRAALRQAVQNSPFGEEMPALAETLDRLLAPLREQARAEQALCNHRLAEIGSERAEAEKRLQALQEKQLPPPAPPLRGDERDGRLGAPFWQLIEFRDETDRAARAGIEAALQAAGLLDAWVNPDGTLGPEQDGFLVAAAPVGRALAELLQVDDSADAVPAAQVERLLASIALDETGTTTVGADGSFTLGLLRGRAVKAEPQFIGASAREGHRRRQIATVEDEIDGLQQQADEVTTRLEEQNERLQLCAELRKTLPPLGRYRQAFQRCARTAQSLHASKEELEEARERSEQTRRRQIEAVAALKQAAAEAGIEADAEALKEQRQAADNYRHELGVLAERGRSLQLARDHATDQQEAADKEQKRAQKLAAEAEKKATETLQAAQRARTLEETIGLASAQVLTQLAETTTEIEQIKERQTSLNAAKDGLNKTLGSAEATGRNAVEREERAVAAFEGELERLRTLALRLGEPLGLAETLTIPDALDAKAARQIAAAIEMALPGGIRGERNEAETSVMRAFQQLQNTLGAEYPVDSELRDDIRLFGVQAPQGRMTVVAMAASLTETLRVSRERLTENEDRMLRQYLLGDIGEHLRERLQAADELIAGINQLLDTVTTSSNVGERLQWKVREEIGRDRKRGIELLRKPVAILTDDEREELIAFLSTEIEAQRAGEDGGDYREQLEAAFDYRNWHQFLVEFRRPGDHWKELTRKRYGSLSGGERAVMLHLPLFAGAAAHYRFARTESPQLIALDEAFAGIDEQGRQKLMELLVALDLDFIMTSQELLPTYKEVPTLMLYQLDRDTAFGAERGVSALAFHWDGETLHDVETDQETLFA